MQRLVVNTLFQEVTNHHNRNDGSRETQKLDPVLEVTTSCLYGKHGVEIRIWSLSEDNTQSWVRISHGSNKFVIDSNMSTGGETFFSILRPPDLCMYIPASSHIFVSAHLRMHSSAHLRMAQDEQLAKESSTYAHI